MYVDDRVITNQGRVRGTRKPYGALGTTVPGGVKGVRSQGGAKVKPTSQQPEMEGFAWWVLGRSHFRAELAKYKPKVEPLCTEQAT